MGRQMRSRSRSQHSERNRSRSRSAVRSSSRSRSRSASRSRSESASRLYALVKWTNPKHVGQFTHNVDTTWIRDFEPAGPFDPTGYTIEWRVPPNLGMDGNSTMVWCLQLAASNDSLHPVPKAASGTDIPLTYRLCLDDLQFLKRKEVGLLNTEKDASSNSLTTSRSFSPSTANSSLNSARSFSPSTSGQHRSQESATSNDMLQVLLAALQRSPASTTAAAKQPIDSEPDQVKIGKVLCISNSCYQQARHCKSATAMTMYLVRAAFSQRRLLRSTYAGQQRKLPDGRIIQKPSLKRYQVMRDIQDFVLARFPITQSAFGSAVNACTGEKARARTEMEYEAEMSCSDED